MEDTPSKICLAIRFLNYKVIDARPVLEQFNDIVHTVNMDGKIKVSSIINMLCPWKDQGKLMKHG